EGYLTAIGTGESPIQIGDPGNRWPGIETRENGSVHMENGTVRSGDYNFQLSGAPSYLKNVTTIGGSHGVQILSGGNMFTGCTILDPTIGFYLFSVVNGMEMIDCHIENCEYGMFIYNSMNINITTTTLVNITDIGIVATLSNNLHMDSCIINDCGSYAVTLDSESSNILVENSRLNGSRSGGRISSDNTTIRGCDIDLGEGFGGWTGFDIYGTPENLLVEDCVVNNCEWGISYTTNKWSDVTVRGTSFGPDVKSVMILGSLTKNGADEEINITFEHCDLNSNTSIVMGLKENSNVQMINSTWNQELDEPFNLSGGEVNISWFVDFKATDGNGDLTPFNIHAEAVNGDELIDIDVNSGYIEDVLFSIGHLNDTQEREILYDLTITSLINPNVMIKEYATSPYPETIMRLV
ncbi:MAG: right-handed parallel beta-helix repeat-containing protein, partial [Thermoplasmata archaeon]|nr:right-handed parallel beta-helix repeat-containing protein [Thermoplasmata archaeon]